MPKFWLGVIANFYFPLLLFCEVDFTHVNPEAAWKDIATQLFELANVGFVFLYFNRLPTLLKAISIGAFALLLSLVIRSYYEYGVPFIYPNVFKKAMIPLGIAGGYAIAQAYGKFNLKILINWIYVFVVAKVLVSFTTGSASGGFQWGSETRFLMASEAGLLLLPLAVYLLNYCTKQDKIYRFLVVLGIIFVAQHRTIWVASAFIILFIVYKYPYLIKKILPMAAIGAGVAILLLSDHIFTSRFVRTLETQVQDIFEYKKQGTGEWRYEQSQFFLVRIAQQPLFGWNFQAYENGDFIDVEIWDDKGTHIHSGYIDPLYYFGVFGLIIYWLGFAGLALKYLRLKGELLLYPIMAIAMFSYGVAYQLPLYAYFFCGLGFYCLRPVTVHEVAEEEPVEEDPALIDLDEAALNTN